MRPNAALGLALLLLTAARMDAATLDLSVSSDALHTGMPFTLTLKAEGFEEEPVPTPPELTIDGCEVTYLGMNPNVSSHVQIVNGRRTDWRQVTFNYRWRVTAPARGRYSVPALRLEQNGDVAQTRPATFQVEDVPSSTDMMVRLQLPERAVWVGETFDVAVEWLLSREVESHEFAVPLFQVDGAQVSAPSAGSGQSLRFAVGASDIALPLERSQVQQGGRTYTRFSFPARVTLSRAAAVDLAPVRVVARLQVGTARDSWGFQRARYELFRAEGQRRRLTVRPLPLAGRPASFINAIGSGFAIDVQASRTVVSVGDPIELTVRLRGDGALTGLSLPPLGSAGLPSAHFGVTDSNPVGEVDEQANSKTFVVTARVKSADVQEVPPLAFSYFDPVAGDYRTVQSQPIALSVGSSQMVSAADVVAAPAAAPVRASSDTGTASGLATLLGADMSLSAPQQTFEQPWGETVQATLLATLYGVPCLAALTAFGMLRTGARRQRGRALRQALRHAEQALGSAAPARDAAPAMAAAMRRLAQVAGADLTACEPTLQRLETSAFDPEAATHPVDGATVGELRGIAKQWSKRTDLAGAATAIAVLTAVAVLTVPTWADLNAAAQQARVLFHEALDETDRLRRVRLFANAERAWRPLAAAHPHAAELQVDWGNAALGAQDAGRAVLAYRRALHSAPGNQRASANLAWLRDRLPIWLPRPASTGALDSLLFWRGRLTAAQLHLAGGAAFAIGVLSLVIWPRRRALRPLAALALLVWVGATASALLADDDAAAAVLLTDGVVLRSADSSGAAPTFANPLPAGTEVSVVESRPPWARIALADGTIGWLPTRAIAPVTHQGTEATRPATIDHRGSGVRG